MSIPAGVTHVVFGGALAGGEVWESGFWVSGAVPESNAVANANAQVWFGQLTAMDSSGAMRATMGAIGGSDTNMTYVRVYCYPTGGPSATYIGYYSSTAINGTKTTVMPNQCALVVSLRTELAGRQHRGRMYLPCTGAIIEATSQITSDNAIAVANAWALCFTDWNASGDNGIVCVVSRVGGGLAVPVSLVSVDSIIDTQRRRRNKLVATYKEVATVTSS